MLCASWFKNMATGIDWTGRRAQATRARTTTDVQIGLPRPTDFATVQYFIQLPPFNVWFFSVSRHRSIILAKKWKLFGQILRNSRKCVKLESLKMLIDHKHASVFFPAVSEKSSWSFSFRWTENQWEKTASEHPFIALLAREEKNKDVFSAIFSFECPFSTPLLCNISSKYPT